MKEKYILTVIILKVEHRNKLRDFTYRLTLITKHRMCSNKNNINILPRNVSEYKEHIYI